MQAREGGGVWKETICESQKRKRKKKPVTEESIIRWILAFCQLAFSFFIFIYNINPNQPKTQWCAEIQIKKLAATNSVPLLGAPGGEPGANDGK